VSDDESRTYSIRRAAAVLGVCTKTLTNKINEGKIPYISVGDRRMLLKDDIEKILTSKRTID
jgi:excisionase family DNA binding protein